ncbi:MAG: DUF2975 domain-containing protein [Patescibacteria group bacterium]
MKITKYFESLIEKQSTNFLRLAIFVIGLIVLAFCVFALPSMWKGGSAEFPEASTSVFLIMLGLYATAIPFYIGLWQGLRLLKLIDKNMAFSEVSINTLRNIKYCLATISVLYVGGVPWLLPIAELDDAPGLILMGMVIACIPITITIFTGIVEKLLQNVVDIKSENDLTV